MIDITNIILGYLHQMPIDQLHDLIQRFSTNESPAGQKIHKAAKDVLRFREAPTPVIGTFHMRLRRIA